MELEADTFRYTIPSQPSGSKVYYYISATNGNTKTITKPLVAPKGLYVFNVESETSTGGLLKNNGLSIFPNPSSKLINISVDGIDKIDEISVVSFTGSVVKSLIVNNKSADNLVIDVSSLPSGGYFLLVKTKDGLLREKFIKK